MRSLRERDQKFSFLFFSPKRINVIRTERIMGSHRDSNRAIYARKLLDDGCILDVSHPCPAVFFGEDHTHQTQFRKFRNQFHGKMLSLVPLHYMRSDFAFSELSNAGANLLLVFSQLEFHKSSVGNDTSTEKREIEIAEQDGEIGVTPS